MRQSLVAAIATLAVSAAFAPSAAAAIGGDFSFAPTSANGTHAPAFPGATAFWAGVCDLRDSDAAVGAPPIDRRFADCIHHPGSSGFGSDALFPPLAVGVAPGESGPDGWTFNTLGPAQGPSWRLDDITQAGSRPDGSASFWFSRAAERFRGKGRLNTDLGPDGQPRNIMASLPAGVIGNPNAVPKCPAADLNTSPVTCHPKTQVGVSTISLSSTVATYPVYNVEPRDGKTAELVISGAGIANVYDANAPVVARARTDGDFGVDAGVEWVPSAASLPGQTFTIWGVPWASSHDRYRPVAGYCGADAMESSTASNAGTAAMHLTGLNGGVANGCSQEPQSYDPSWGPIRPFFAIQTECTPESPVTSIFADNWHSNVTATALSPAPPLTGCEDIQFDASFLMQTTSSAPDSASGINVDFSIPQNNDPPASVRRNPDDDSGAPAHWESKAGLARSHLKDSFVTLPAGFSVNPSTATGLAGCTDAQIGVTNAASNPLVFNDGDPFNKDGGADGAECPDGSVIGTAEVTTPLLEEKLTGEVVLGEAKSTDPRSNQMFRMFIVIRNRERGVIAKIHGRTAADGVRGEGGTGQISAIFENNPRVPFNNLKLSFKGGSKGVLATPQACGNHGWTSRFTAWSGAPDVPQGGQFPIAGDCSIGFAPSLATGMDTRQARAHGNFSFRFARNDGEQWFGRLTARLPQGLLASVKGLIGSGLCSNAQAAAAACPASSRIGTVDAKAGSGDPFVLEQKGEMFLTEGYKGGEYGLAVKVRPIAGPFRGAMELSTIVVRQAIHVDRNTAQVTAVSDDFPRVWHGVPLRVREVTVNVDRPDFMINPANCAAKQVGADLVSVTGATTTRAEHFQATGCRALPFKPKLRLRLTGRRQTRTGRHPGIRAVVTQKGVAEAGIRKAEVRLPKSLALDVDNAQALCEFEDGIKPDLENHCPKGSIVGRARAFSPLLNKPLVGNVYFVKNIRIDPDTGNEIRTLPTIRVALRGEISINLKGDSDVKRGKLVNTFDNVPDAPVSRFNMNIKGGKNGIVAVTRTRRGMINLCRKPRSHVAQADMDGQNGKRHDRDITMKTPCRKRQRSARKICRKRTNSKPAFKRCVTKVKRNRAQAKRRAAAKKKAAARR